MVTANIEARVLVPMASALAEKVREGGVLVLSGILREQEDVIREAFEASFETLEVLAQDGWIALVLRRLGPLPNRASAAQLPR